MLRLFVAAILLAATATLGLAQTTAYIGKENTILSIDLATGDRFILADDDTGTGVDSFYVFDIVVEDDDSLLASDSGLGVIQRVDRTTGDRTIVTNPFGGTPIGSGPGFSFPLEFPRGMTLKNANTVYLAVGFTGLMEVDLATGDRTYVSVISGAASSPQIGGGDTWFAPYDVVLDVSGDPIVDDVSFDKLYSVDTATGDRTDLGGRGGFTIARLLDGDYVLAHQAGYLSRVDSSTLAVTVLSGDPDGPGMPEPEVGSGVSFMAVVSATAGANGIVYAYEVALGFGVPQPAIFTVDPDTGDRTIVSSGGIGTGPFEMGFPPPDVTFPIAVDGGTPPSAVADWTSY